MEGESKSCTIRVIVFSIVALEDDEQRYDTLANVSPLSLYIFFLKKLVDSQSYHAVVGNAADKNSFLAIYLPPMLVRMFVIMQLN